MTCGHTFEGGQPRVKVGSEDDSDMTTIAISSSARHHEEVKDLALQLRRQGHVVSVPNFEFLESKETPDPKELTLLAQEFFGKIEASEVLLVNSVGGYAGVSVCLEVGFAHALGKTIIFVETPLEAAIASLGSVLDFAEGSIGIPL